MISTIICIVLLRVSTRVFAFVAIMNLYLLFPFRKCARWYASSSMTGTRERLVEQPPSQGSNLTSKCVYGNSTSCTVSRTIGQVVHVCPCLNDDVVYEESRGIKVEPVGAFSCLALTTALPEPSTPLRLTLPSHIRSSQSNRFTKAPYSHSILCRAP